MEALDEQERYQNGKLSRVLELGKAVVARTAIALGEMIDDAQDVFGGDDD